MRLVGYGMGRRTSSLLPVLLPRKAAYAVAAADEVCLYTKSR
jgi:hypothetical protein